MRAALFILLITLAPSAQAAPSPLESCQNLLRQGVHTVEKVWRLLFPERSPVIKESPFEESENSDSYISGNAAVERSPDDKPTAVLARFNQPRARFFSDHAYADLDARTGAMSHPPPEGLPVLRAGDPLGLQLQIEVSRLRADQGFLPVPFGFRAVSYFGKGLELHQTESGLTYKRNLQVESTTVHIRLSPVPGRALTSVEKARLTEVQHAPALDEYPIEWQHALKDLLARRTAMSDLEIARALREFIARTLLYEMDDSPERGTLALCRRGAVQCDGAVLIYVSILRSVFQIPAYAQSGYISSREVAQPGDSVVLDQSTPHMFAAVYDDAKNRFVALDPTPSRKTRETEESENHDERFKDWPNPDGASGDDLDEDEQSLEPGSREEFANSLSADGPLLEIEATWRKLFQATGSARWVSLALQISEKLLTYQNLYGLPPEFESMAREMEYLSRILQVIPRRSWQEMIREVTVAKQDPQEYKQVYLYLDVLNRLASYGMDYAAAPQTQRELRDATQRLLNLLPPAPMLDLEKTFLEELPGAFARELYAQKPELRSKLQQMADLHRKVRLARRHESRTFISTAYDWLHRPTDDEELDFVVAEDFEHWAHFERQGLPPRFDALRVQHDDMLVRRWREPVSREREHGRPERPGKELTIILFDLSTSMNGQRSIVRDRLIQAWIDELMSQNPSSLIQLLGYSDDPSKPIAIDDVEPAQKLFNDMAAADGFFKNIKGTETARAFEKAIRIARSLGHEYQKVNFRLITDGDETLNIDLFRQAKDSLGTDTELNLTAVTIEKGNPSLEQFVRESSDANLVQDSVYVHLDRQMIVDILYATGNLPQMGALIPENYALLAKASASQRRLLQRLADQFND